MRLLSVLAMLAALLCAGCARRVVIVLDSTGNPVAGADVRPASLSVNGASTKTDASGQTDVSLNVGGQDAKWISIRKQGFDPVEVAVPSTWPLRVTLAPAGTAKLGIQITPQP